MIILPLMVFMKPVATFIRSGVLRPPKPSLTDEAKAKSVAKVG
jgi:hypothetical protein